MGKLRNKEIIIDGVKYRSTLEGNTAKLLKEAGLQYKYEPWEIILQDKFKDSNLSFEESKKKMKVIKSSRQIAYTPDFIGSFWIMETKGMKTPDFAIKWKMFKVYLEENELEHVLFMPRNLKQVKECIQIIKNMTIAHEVCLVVDVRRDLVNRSIEELKLKLDKIPKPDREKINSFLLNSENKDWLSLEQEYITTLLPANFLEAEHAIKIVKAWRGGNKTVNNEYLELKENGKFD